MKLSLKTAAESAFAKFYGGTDASGHHIVVLNGKRKKYRGALFSRYVHRDETTGDTTNKLKALRKTVGYVRGCAGEKNLLLSSDGKNIYRLFGVRATVKSHKKKENKLSPVVSNSHRDVLPSLTKKARATQTKLQREFAAIKLQRDAGADPKVSIDVVSTITGLSRATIYREVSRGKLHIIKNSSRTRFSYAAVIEYANGDAENSNSHAKDRHHDSSRDFDDEGE
jgi:predicted DNA-binding transcriptional regulator AlpA